MTLSARGRQQKGDKAEREVLAFLREQLGEHIVRARQEGEYDRGDIGGLPDMVLQVKSYVDVSRALREGLDDVIAQKRNSGLLWGCAFLRRPGGRYAVVMWPEDWVSLYREAYLGGVLGPAPRMSAEAKPAASAGAHAQDSTF